MMRLSSLAVASHGTLIGSDLSLTGITTDSRRDCTDRLFVALRGENFDAHDFVSQAENRGATAFMVERQVESSRPIIQVADCHQGLKDMAAWWRAQFVVPVIGVTGSAGKTTVKEMLASVFSELGRGLVTQGNLNNEIGVPLTLLRFSAEDQYAIVEMGMNQAGEIARLTNITRPTVAIINNAGAAHLEGLGTVAAVAEAKGEILQGLSDDGIAIINADDRHAQLWLALAGDKKVITFGLDQPADVTAQCELFQGYSLLHAEHEAEQFSIKLSVPGKHNVANALATIAAARAANVPVGKIVAGLEAYRPIAGRLNINQVGNLTIINDTYNANPNSVAAAINVLAAHDNSTLILGDMAELGSVAAAEHEKIGRLAKSKKIDQLLACGAFADRVAHGFGPSAIAVNTQQQLLDHLAAHPVMAGTVLVKGSRSARMEKIVEYLFALNDSQPQLGLAEGGH